MSRRNLPKIGTLLRNSSYCLRFLIVLPCHRQHNSVTLHMQRVYRTY